MAINSLGSSTFRLLVVGLGLAVLAGCTTPASRVASSGADASMNEIYAEAVNRSAIVNSSYVRPLVAIPSDQTMVNVVTWTTQETAEKYYVIGEAKVGVDVWVTIAPQIKLLCSAYSTEADALKLRLQQLLGLPPDPAARVFVVMKVRATHIFRPCPDPDPTKDKCGPEFPAGLADGEAHKAWFAEQTVSRYRDPKGYPWTRLGYTYDWNPETLRYGASEYVVRKGSPVTVKDRVPTQAYCHPAAG